MPVHWWWLTGMLLLLAGPETAAEPPRPSGKGWNGLSAHWVVCVELLFRPRWRAALRRSSLGWGRTACVCCLMPVHWWWLTGMLLPMLLLLLLSLSVSARLSN